MLDANKNKNWEEGVGGQGALGEEGLITLTLLCLFTGNWYGLSLEGGVGGGGGVF